MANPRYRAADERQDFCSQRVPAGGPFCTNPPTHHLDTNYGYLGALCDEHWEELVASGAFIDASAEVET